MRWEIAKTKHLKTICTKNNTAYKIKHWVSKPKSGNVQRCLWNICRMMALIKT